MDIKITLSISKENSPLDTPPFRAYMYWSNNGQLVKAEDFSEIGLASEVMRLQAEGSPHLQEYQDALNRLKSLNAK